MIKGPEYQDIDLGKPLAYNIKIAMQIAYRGLS